MQEKREVHECHPRAGGPPGHPVERLKAERVQLALAELPGWKLTPDGRVITRTFRFEHHNGSLLFAFLVSGLGREAGHSPAMTIAAEAVVCQLTTPEAGGVTERDLELARRIDRVV